MGGGNVRVRSVNPQAMGGWEVAARFCGFEAPVWSSRSAKTVTPRGGRDLHQVDRAEACELRCVAIARCADA